MPVDDIIDEVCCLLEKQSRKVTLNKHNLGDDQVSIFEAINHDSFHGKMCLMQSISFPGFVCVGEKCVIPLQHSHTFDYCYDRH